MTETSLIIPALVAAYDEVPVEQVAAIAAVGEQLEVPLAGDLLLRLSEVSSPIRINSISAGLIPFYRIYDARGVAAHHAIAEVAQSVAGAITKGRLSQCRHWRL